MTLDTKELKTITLLYVEDDAIIRDQLQPILEKLFKKAFIAVDGVDGLEIYTQNIENIDIIVTDINMPNMNGLDMIKNINELNTSIPVIVITAHTDSNFMLEAINLNVDKYMPKPIQIKELTVNIVNMVLKYRRLNNIENLAKSLVQKSDKSDELTNSLNYKLDISQKENSYNKAIIDNLVITFRVDKNGNILSGSNKFYRYFSFDKDEVIGQSIDIMRCESCNQETFQKMMLKAIHTKKTVVSSYSLKLGDDKTVECDVTMSATYDEQSLVDGYILYLDIL
ncbi:MAG: response regulator [Campylobacterota bacterium]|nr:response regulator [Campylobacterota bacterium]